jgi:NAD(P)-dependent dehydrogenase (short-subunit alcohol dehydrogenase family)
MANQFPHGRIALITGASSGIGAATALLFAEKGYTVYGASRRGSIPGTDRAGTVHPLVMDLTGEGSIADGIGEIMRNEGRIDILVHAAGDGLAGPVESSTAEDARKQMDVNYFGAVRLLNAVLPVMRKQRSGLVILIGSVGGIFSIPFQTLYSSSKAALTMLCDGLRMELKPFNIHSALILPGDIKTGFTAARRNVSNPCPEEYRAAMDRAVSTMERDEKNGMSPELAARDILKTAETRRPKAHRIVGASYRVLAFLNRLLPYWAVEKLIRTTYLRD